MLRFLFIVPVIIFVMAIKQQKLAHEGLVSIMDHIQSRKINIPKQDLLRLLTDTDPNKSPEISTLSQTIQDQVKDLTPGSCVLCYKGFDCTEKEELILNIGGWRGTNTLRCYVTDYNAAHYLRLLGGDYSKYDVNKFQKTSEMNDENEEKANESSNR